MYFSLVCSLLVMPAPGPWEPTGSEVAAPDASTSPASGAAVEPAPAVTPAPAAAPSPAAAPAPAPAPAPASRLQPKGDAARWSEAPLKDNIGAFKPGTGLMVASADGRFSLQFTAFGQFQLQLVHRPEQPMTMATAAVPAHNDLTVHFRRGRFALTGNLFTPHIKYRIQFTFAPAELLFKDGVPHRSPILDWFFTFDRFRDFTLVAGQYKVPYNHQRMLRVTDLQFVDRSTANFEFTGDRDVGLDVRSKDLGGLGKLRYYLGVYLGDGVSKYGVSDLGLMYLGRFEVLPFGQYDDLTEGDLERSLKPRMLIGGAYAFIDRDPHTNHGFGLNTWADGGSASTHNATADLNFKIAGFSLSGAFFWRTGWRQPGTAVDAMGTPIAAAPARSGLGYFAQVGYLIPRVPLELGFRWNQIRGSRRVETSLPDQTEVGGVFNYYIARHSVKLQLDYLRLASAAQVGPSDQVRLQLQAMF